LSRLFNFIASNSTCALIERAKHHGRSRGKGFDKSALKTSE
jgi:hypothetical protein